MGVRWRQFKWLVWKNFVLQWRRPIGTVFEILTPVTLTMLLVIARIGLENTFDEDMCFVQYQPTNFTNDKIRTLPDLPFPIPLPIATRLPFDVPTKLPDMNELFCNITKECGPLAWYPQTDLTTRMMREVSLLIQVPLVETKFESEEEMEKVITEDIDNYYGAVVFDFPANDSVLPLFTPYRIRLSSEDTRWFTTETYPYYSLNVPVEYHQYDDKFMELQHAVDYTIISFQSDEYGTGDYMVGIRREVQRYPYPEWRIETFITTMQFLMPIIMILSLIYSDASIVKELVLEKQTRLKESMKMMGLSNWLHWTAWFVKCFLFLMISGLIMSILIKAGEVFRYSDFLCILILLTLWIIAGIMWGFAISVFFSKAKIAMVFAVVFWYLNYVVIEFILIDYYNVTASQKVAACLLQNTCLGLAIQTISRLESQHVGMTWETLTQSPAHGYDVPILLTWIMFVVDTILYGLIAWYIEAVFPGEFGIPRPFYFPFTKSYWTGSKKEETSNKNAPANEMQMDSTNDNNHEPEPVDMTPGIKIRKLKKVYDSSVGSKVAVDNLNVTMFENQITSLLGHNGAGKTTTMSILTGLFPPTAGTAVVNGYNIATDMDSIRQHMGLCPQHNILFDRLTVKEHLKFFLALKGITGHDAKQLITDMIKDLNLVDKENSKSSELSGGMKRKLSVAIALIGRPKIVMLDEPTAGMDPYARRSTWDLLLKHKDGKTIILTTHSMDEADLLGDRIAIMASGHLICSGTSLFLKNRFGIGYHLTLVKTPSCVLDAVAKRIHTHVPHAEMSAESGAELSYILPRESTASFKAMCKALEDDRENLGIASFGISVTTLEEVFLKVDQMAEEENNDEPSTLEAYDNDHLHNKGADFSDDVTAFEAHDTTKNGTGIGKIPGDASSSGSSYNEIHPSHTEIDVEQDAYEQEGILSGFSLKWLQLKAIFIKRLLHSKRDKKAIVTQLMLPLVFVLFGLLLMVIAPLASEETLRTLTLHNISRENPDARVFCADLRSDVNDRPLLEFLSRSLSNQGMTSMNITDAVFQIRDENSGNLVNGVELTNEMDCCTYTYQVLNAYCSDVIYASADEDTNTCSDVNEFGYYNCPECVTNPGYYSDSFDDECPVGADENMLPYMNTYFEEYVLRDSSIGEYFEDHVAGFTMVDDKNNTNSTLITVWYSNQPYHASVEALAVLDNSLLHYMTNTSHNLLVTNHPLPASAAKEINDSTQQSLILAICAVFGLGFLSASFAPFLIQEKTSKAKLLQFVSGLGPISYWIGTLFWDAINYTIVLILLVILFGAFPTVYSPPNLGVTTLILILFGWASTPMTYVLSWPFDSPLAGYGLIALLYSLGALITLITVFILFIVESTQDAAVVCDYIFMLLPTHCLGRALVYIAQNDAAVQQCTASQIDRQVCDASGIEYEENFLAWNMPGIGQHCFYLFLEGIFFILLTLLLQVRFFIPSRSPTELPSVDITEDDVNVAEERAKVSAMLKPEESGYAVVLKKLTKVYTGAFDSCRKTSRQAVVNHLCLTIPKGECFGLLGINGAGKTTSFRMMTGDLSMSAGTAYMGGYNILTDRRQVQQRIGYCPQFDALIDKLTGRELIRMYARLRGIPTDTIEAVVDSCISHLNLGNWADKLCGDYSGGNKRKLSTAIAIVGNPPILFLDEPTAGMDPRARRFLWNAITRLMKGGRSVVLTSHSMEECEALCTRLAIMVNGQFKCLGSTQHLKTRFGKGYSLMVKVDYDADTAPVKQFLEDSFPGMKLLEEHMGMLSYQIDNGDLSWSYIFGTIEDNKDTLHLIDYSVSQTSLEQVFINFAKEQT
ncbi:phospholipid-transporting ATPase ABCA3-like [Saccoglossus kowalevskii]